MGNIAMSGIPPELATKLNIDFSTYPPWAVVWASFSVDVLCTPLQCRSSWRSHLPDSLGGPGGWCSEQYEIGSVAAFFSHQRYSEEFPTITEGTAGGVVEFLKSLYQYMFFTSSTALSNLFSPIGLSTMLCLVFVIRIIKSQTLPRFRTIGLKLAKQAHGEEWLLENEIRITKFGEYVYRLCYHSFISLVGFYLFWDSPWWNEDQGGTVNLYTNFPHNPVKPGMAWYYLFQAAYNVDAMFSLLEISFEVKVFPKESMMPLTTQWSEDVRGDFNEMLVHHVITNSLVFLSSYLRQTRIGSMVFWMHDISDVPVDICKLANFVKWHNGTAAAFGLLSVMWFATRLYVLPFIIWKSVYTQSVYLSQGNPDKWLVYFYAFQPVFLILLGALIVLHLVWFSMFIEMGMVLIRKGEAHDLTEHKAGEAETTPTKNSSNGKNGAKGAAKKKIT